MGTQQCLDDLVAAIENEFGLTAEAPPVPPEVIDAAIAGLSPWARPLLNPWRYKCLYGGRGSGKSYGATDVLLIEGARRKIRVLCAREFQNSIEDSVHYLLKERIEALGLGTFYQVQQSAIIGANGTSFTFKGIRRNVQSIKSMAGLTHCWIEEAQTISAESWRVLVPTIREEGSEIWVTFNPHQKSDPIYEEFITKGKANGYIQRVNWNLNPHFPATLDEERREMQRTDPDLYAHIWEGEPLERTDAQILGGKWMVDEFEPGADWDGPYHGADWGFSSDPTAAVRCWVHGRRLYVERESLAYKLELDQVGRRWMLDIPGIDRYEVRADNSRPESISHVRRGREHEVPPIPRLIACPKWPGSVEDGIEHLRSYDKIVIHPRCKHTAEEARLYSYKIDRLTEEVSPAIVDKHNHLIDSLRYALQPLIKPRLQQHHRAHTRRNW
ncbi:MAG: PBSX family phage terminase large subunit [Leptolyngbya sp. SIO1D8]|nr:PBSX family phage terminase large subunit [Leptolyngbya sp. SIO1D8]